MATKFTPQDVMTQMMNNMSPRQADDVQESFEKAEGQPQPVQEPEPAPAESKPSRSASSKKGATPITVEMPTDIYEKIRWIAKKNNVTMKSVIIAGADLFIESYTKKYGMPKTCELKKKGSARDLL